MTVDRVGSQRFQDTSQPQMGTWGKRLTECSVAVMIVNHEETFIASRQSIRKSASQIVAGSIKNGTICAQAAKVFTFGASAIGKNVSSASFSIWMVSVANLMRVD
jgi:hypothetical protein